MSFNKDKAGGTTVNESSQTTTPQPTAEETELNKLALDRERFLDPQIRETQSSGLNLANLLLQGQELPGFLQGLPGGISPEVTAEIAQESIRDIQPFFQQSGLLNSGVNASISGRIAGDIRRSSEEFNLQLLTQLLNQGLGGQAQVQQPILGQTALLSQRLAGLRPVTSTATGSTNQTTFTQPSFLTREIQFLGAANGGTG